MASALVSAVAVPAVRERLDDDTAIQAIAGERIYEKGKVPQRPAYPYIEVESSTEAPLNTMGSVDELHWGGQARVIIRVIDQYPRGEDAGLALCSLVIASLSGHRFDLTGFGRSRCELQNYIPLGLGEVAGVKTLEFVLEFLITAHQGNA